MSEWYDAYLKSKEWQRTRLRRLLRANLDDDFNVIQCDDSECQMWFPLGLVEVHHKNYKRVGRERMSDLEVLCGGCHNYRHFGIRPSWWHELKRGNAKMVTAASYRRLSQLQHIGEVVDHCLVRRDIGISFSRNL